MPYPLKHGTNLQELFVMNRKIKHFMVKTQKYLPQTLPFASRAGFQPKPIGDRSSPLARPAKILNFEFSIVNFELISPMAP